MKKTIIAALAITFLASTAYAHEHGGSTRHGLISKPCSEWNKIVGGNGPDNMERLAYEYALQAYLSGMAGAWETNHDFMETHYTWEDSEEWLEYGCANDPTRRISQVAEEYLYFIADAANNHGHEKVPHENKI